MLGFFSGLIIGVLGGGVIMFFVAKNNQAKFNKALNSEAKDIADQLLAETDLDEKAAALVKSLKSKLDK